jgi:hypothetical protein
MSGPTDHASPDRREDLGREDVAERGDALYKSEVRPRIDEDAEHGKFVVIDVHSGAFEIDDDEMAAGDRLAARRPDARVWLTRVGSRYAYSFGARPRTPGTSS